MTFNLLPQLGVLAIQPPVKVRALKPDIIRGLGGLRVCDVSLENSSEAILW